MTPTRISPRKEILVQPFRPSAYTSSDGTRSMRASQLNLLFPKVQNVYRSFLNLWKKQPTLVCQHRSTSFSPTTWEDTRKTLQSLRSSSHATCNSPLRRPMTARLRCPFWTRMSKNASSASWIFMSFLYCGSSSCWPSSTARTCVLSPLSVNFELH